MKTFSDRLKHARALRSLTQQDLARASGLSQSAVASYENGQRQSSRSVRKLAAALQVNLDWLETGKGSMESLADYSASPAGGAYYLMEPGSGEAPPRALPPWPFTTIARAQYEALAARDKRLLEQMLRSFCRSLPCRIRRRPRPRAQALMQMLMPVCAARLPGTEARAYQH